MPKDLPNDRGREKKLHLLAATQGIELRLRFESASVDREMPLSGREERSRE